MRDDGSYSDDEWAHIYTAGGADAMPLGVTEATSRPRAPRYGPERSAFGAWCAAVAALVFVVPAVLGLFLGVRAGLRGNRTGWLAALANVAAPIPILLLAG